MFEESFLQNMGIIGRIETARLQCKLREQEAEIQRLKAKIRERESETSDVCCVAGLMDFWGRAVERGELTGLEPILIHDGDDYKLLGTRCRISTIQAVTNGGKNPIKPFNGQRYSAIDTKDCLDKVIVLE